MELEGSRARMEFPIQLVVRLSHQLLPLPHQLHGLPHQFSIDLEASVFKTITFTLSYALISDFKVSRH